MIDRLFYGCVDLLQQLARRTGLTYEQLNVLVFCLLWPALTIAETVAILILLCH